MIAKNLLDAVRRAMSATSALVGVGRGKNLSDCASATYTGFDPATDTNDGTHPNAVGSQKMAERWAAALAEHGLL